MPLIPNIIQGNKDHTRLIAVRKKSDKNYYEILGDGCIGNKELAVSLVLADANEYDVLYISVFSSELKYSNQHG